MKKLRLELLLWWRMLRNRSDCCNASLFDWDYKHSYCEQCGKEVKYES